MSYTPGPWEAAPWDSEGEPEPFKFTIWSKAEGGPAVAIVETTPANAALMEAAPDMLAAGKAVLEDAADLVPGRLVEVGEDDMIVSRVLLDRLRAAIDKAEGRK